MCGIVEGGCRSERVLPSLDFSDAQREHYKYCIHDNVHETVHKLCQAAITWGMDGTIKDRNALDLILSKDAGLQNGMKRQKFPLSKPKLTNPPIII